MTSIFLLLFLTSSCGGLHFHYSRRAGRSPFLRETLSLPPLRSTPCLNPSEIFNCRPQSISFFEIAPLNADRPSTTTETPETTETAPVDDVEENSKTMETEREEVILDVRENENQIETTTVATVIETTEPTETTTTEAVSTTAAPTESEFIEPLDPEVMDGDDDFYLGNIDPNTKLAGRLSWKAFFEDINQRIDDEWMRVPLKVLSCYGEIVYGVLYKVEVIAGISNCSRYEISTYELMEYNCVALKNREKEQYQILVTESSMKMSPFYPDFSRVFSVRERVFPADYKY